MLKLKARRGAVVILLGVLFFSTLAISAVAIDFSRMWSLRNELQTSADAGAYAGAVELFPNGTHVAANAPDSARAYAHANKAMQDTVIIDSLTLGDWDDPTSTFTPGINPPDAIRVVVSRDAKGLIMTGLGVPMPRLKARAIGWANAPVVAANCMRPWAIPYPLLMFRINTYRGIQNTIPNLTRPYDPVADLAALQAMTAAQRTFSLKIGSGLISDPMADSLNISGHFQGVQLGKYWDAATQTYPTPGPIPGANEYRDNVAGRTCYALAVGDSLITQQGVIVGPTLQGGEVSGNPPAGICQTIVDNNGSDATHGDCINSSGGVGVDIKSAFYLCATGCNGSSTVEVSMLGSFTLMKIYPDNKAPGTDAAEIVGVFNPLQDDGPVGGGMTTLSKPVLVK